MNFSSLKESFSFIQLFLLILISAWIIFPYLKTEILSAIYLSAEMDTEVSKFCQEKNKENPLKYTKMLTRSNREARILCVHKDNSENLIVDLRKSEAGNWKINFNTKQDSGGSFYWPYYR